MFQFFIDEIARFVFLKVAPVTYYHIECENYLQDNIVTEGLVVESFATLKTTGGRTDIYTWNSRKNAYTRVGHIDNAKIIQGTVTRSSAT